MPTPPLITLEEHFLTTPTPPSLLTQYTDQLAHVPSVLSKLTSLSTLRRTDLATNGIALQVISHAPGLAG